MTSTEQALIPLLDLRTDSIKPDERITVVRLVIYRYVDRTGIQLINFLEQEKLLCFNPRRCRNGIVKEIIPLVLFIWHEPPFERFINYPFGPSLLITVMVQIYDPLKMMVTIF